MAEMCREMYDRGGEMIPCTYVRGHPTPRHSWETLRLQDAADKAVHTFSMKGVPSDVEALLVNINHGNADAYLEVILAVTHNRKRALRNTPGFGLKNDVC
jgi:hypothetical protein